MTSFTIACVSNFTNGCYGAPYDSDRYDILNAEIHKQIETILKEHEAQLTDTITFLFGGGMGGEYTCFLAVQQWKQHPPKPWDAYTYRTVVLHPYQNYKTFALRQDLSFVTTMREQADQFSLLYNRERKSQTDLFDRDREIITRSHVVLLLIDAVKIRRDSFRAPFYAKNQSKKIYIINPIQLRINQLS